METSGIAEKVQQIIENFRENVHQISDEEVEEVMRHCKAKMALTGKEESYILYLLPDELKDHCYRMAANAMSLLIETEREEELCVNCV